MIGSDCSAKPVEVEIMQTKIILNPDDQPIIIHRFKRDHLDKELSDQHEGHFHETKEQLIAALYK